jgi:SAM-dependent methyltransferase
MTLSLPLLMDLCNEVFYTNEQIFDSLQRWAQQRSITSLVDVAGGTGFPVIEFAQKRYDVTYVDGSASMARAFQEKCIKRKLSKVPDTLVCRWGDIHRRTPKRFDGLLCRGNSLAYINSWQETYEQQSPKAQLIDAIRDFYELLKPGGFMYLDKYKLNPKDQGSSPIIRKTGIAYAGSKWGIEWQVHTDTLKKTRVWSGKYWDELSPEIHRFDLPSLMFSTEEIASICKWVGFEIDAHRAPIKGENSFEVIEARKPR